MAPKISKRMEQNMCFIMEASNIINEMFFLKKRFTKLLNLTSRSQQIRQRSIPKDTKNMMSIRKV